VIYVRAPAEASLACAPYGKIIARPLDPAILRGRAIFGLLAPVRLPAERPTEPSPEPESSPARRAPQGATSPKR